MKVKVDWEANTRQDISKFQLKFAPKTTSKRFPKEMVEMSQITIHIYLHQKEELSLL